MEVSGRKDWDDECFAVDIKTEANEIIVCQPCKEDGERLPAEGYCEVCRECFCSACLRVHRKQSATRNHSIIPINEMPNGIPSSDTCSEICAKHTELIKYFCREHDVVGCGDCIILEHKTCKVDLIQDISRQYRKSANSVELFEQLSILKNTINERTLEIVKDRNAIEAAYLEALEEIKVFRQELNSYLDRMEAEMLDKIDRLKTEDMSILRDLETKCEMVEKEIDELHSKMDVCSDMISQQFVLAKMAQKAAVTGKATVDQILKRKKVTKYKFVPEESLINRVKKRLPIGELKENQFAKLTASFSGFQKVQAAGEMECYISGLTMISGEEMLLADIYNRSLKVLNLAKAEITAKTTFSKGPWDVTNIRLGLCAATIPDDGKIVFLKPAKGFTEQKHLKVRYQCRGIDYKNGVFAVSYCGPSKIELLNENGDCLFSSREINELAKAYPGHIALTNDSTGFYVSDNNAGLLFMDRSGQVVEHGKNILSRPRGVVVTDDGTVIIGCQGTRDALHLLIPHTGEIRTLKLTDVKSPHTICFSQEQNKLYACEYGTDSNRMKVFDMK